MSKISLARVARALDTMLDGQMTAQARIAAHLVAAEEAGRARRGAVHRDPRRGRGRHRPRRGVDHRRAGRGLSHQRAERLGRPMPFEFYPDPALQPQAWEFHALLSLPVDADGVVAQAAQVREIDNEVYKYVGVSGVESAPDRAGRQRARVRGAGAERRVHVAGDDRGAGGVRRARSPERRSHRQARRDPACLRGDPRPADGGPGHSRGCVRGGRRGGRVVPGRGRREVAAHRALDPHRRDSSPGAGRRRDLLERSGRRGGWAAGGRGGRRRAPHCSRASDGALYKYVEAAGAGSGRVVRVGLPIDDGSLVSPRFDPAAAG